MKTLILISLLALTACNNDDVKGRPVIVAKYTTLKEGYCKYYYNGLGIRGQQFQDSCNKYSIGDTIK